MISAPFSLSATARAYPSLLLIYTGGTFAMQEQQGRLGPTSVSDMMTVMPEWQHLPIHLDLCSFERPLDSACIEPLHWQALARCIATYYESYAGFVILHGTDTMAYSAAALSYMLEGLRKPIIFTGAQVPIRYPRSDARSNLLSALEIAAAQHKKEAYVQEVAICFGKKLLRGNRSSKYNTHDFVAYHSPNYPLLAQVEQHINYHKDALFRPLPGAFNCRPEVDTQVGVLPLFPGLSKAWCTNTLSTPGLRGLLIYSYGVGNACKAPWFYKTLERAISQGLCVLNISQCPHGSTAPRKYQTGAQLYDLGVIDGKDMGPEAAITKLMCILGREKNVDKIRTYMNSSLSGEISV